jgi:hypothetical protein
MEHTEPVYIRFTYYSSWGLARYNLDLVCVAGVTLDKGSTEGVTDCIFFLWKKEPKIINLEQDFCTPHNIISS